MADFNRAYAKTSGHEGYYVSQEWFRKNGDTRSGETYMGIDRNANPTWEGWAIIDKYKAQNGAIPYNTRLPQNLGLEELVKKRAKEKYWDVIKGDYIQSQDIAEMVFEQVWGGYTGIKGVQKVINTLSPNDLVAVNGKVDGDTLAKLNTLPQNQLYQGLYNDRMNWINTTGNRINPKAVNGWKNRLEKFRKTISEQVSMVSQNVISTTQKGVVVVQNHPAILIAGIALVGIGLYMTYRYFNENKTNQPVYEITQ